MGKVCAVKECYSGSRDDKYFREAKKLRQASLFKVPKCPDRRKLWSNILGCHLDISQVVCDQHFSDKDVKKSDVILLTNGVVETIPHIRWGLQQNALPTRMQIDNEALMAECEQRGILAQTVDDNEEQHDQSNDFIEELSQNQSMNEDSDNGTTLNDENPCGRNYGPAIPLENPAPSILSLDSLKACLKEGLLSEAWSWMQKGKNLIFTLHNRGTFEARIHMEMAEDLFATIITITERRIPLGQVTSMVDIRAYCQAIEKRQECSGTGMEAESRASNCIGVLDIREEYKHRFRVKRCVPCRVLRNKLKKRANQTISIAKDRAARSQLKLALARKKSIRLKTKTENLQRNIIRLKRKFSMIKEAALEEKISTLPEVQQEAVRCCFAAAKVASKNGRRYTLEWMYECVLMHIKNSRLYESIRKREILPLPCPATITKYFRKISSSAYGFQQATLECLRIKGSRLNASDKRGALLVDEMKLSESISFNPQTLEFCGFANLGEHTPEHQRNTRADHALVFMFQLFRGNWVQVLGCFFSKDSARSGILHKLVIECVVLLGNIGFHVDALVSDGAQWNRGVWSLLGINETNFSCPHPRDPSKRLWMISDFPHLVKCFRNCIIGKSSFQTPDGIIKKEHWQAILRLEGFTKPNLKIAYNLTPTHLNPTGYQKMNVPLAFQLFSLPVQTAMKFYRDKGECQELSDSLPTQKFVKRIDDLITAMMSRTPLNALRPGENYPQRAAIVRFLEYFKEWETLPTKEKMPISASTRSGIKVSLGATLEMIDTLKNEANWEYLMTSRLTQDALERWFGMARGACGGNDHPNPQTFLQIFRLLCSYSLIKPPRGGNVDGVELLRTLMETKESMTAARQPKRQWLEKIDLLLDGIQPGDNEGTPSYSADHEYAASLVLSQASRENPLADHSYDVTRTSDEVQAYISGYVVRKMMRWLKCAECINTLRRPENEPSDPRDSIIETMNCWGGLSRPSDDLFTLTSIIEATVLDVVGKCSVKWDTLQTILEKLSEKKGLPMVGCPTHMKEATRKIMNFYIVMRGHFLSNSYNANNDVSRQKARMYRKSAKLA